jgi:hypothetical protein
MVRESYSDLSITFLEIKIILESIIPMIIRVQQLTIYINKY